MWWTKQVGHLIRRQAPHFFCCRRESQPQKLRLCCCLSQGAKSKLVTRMNSNDITRLTRNKTGRTGRTKIQKILKRKGQRWEARNKKKNARRGRFKSDTSEEDGDEDEDEEDLGEEDKGSYIAY